MADPARNYLDNAATSWPKPESVYRAVDRYLREGGAAAGRGAYREGTEASDLVARCRKQLAGLIHAADPRQIVFTLNGTDALNLAIHGALQDGGHVVTTAVEHNSVLRPLGALEDAGRIRVTRVSCDATGRVSAAEMIAALADDTRLLVMTHASNVTGAMQPVAEVIAAARRRGVLTLLDAAQTLGDRPIDVQSLDVDLLAAPGHKGLLGPLGTGVLYLRPGIEQRLSSVRQGGTGSHSEQDRQPAEMPDKFEAGNLNVAGIAGLSAGLEYLADRGLSEINAHSQTLTARLIEGLSAIDGVQVFGPAAGADRVGIVSFRVAGYDPQEVALVLDTTYRIQARPGLHCAPLAHRALGTLDDGGTIRFSPGPFTTHEQIEQAISAVQEIAAAAMAR